jgi:hypothetical protein
MLQTLRVIVDVDVGADPITGRVAAIDAAPREFTGYVSLIAALEELRRNQRDRELIGPDVAAGGKGNVC